MTASMPPILVQRYAPPLLTVIFCCLIGVLSAAPSAAQDTSVYVRLHLRDKGVARRTLAPGDSLYDRATAHLTARAFARRAKVLPVERLVTTDDLPIFAPYLAEIIATGARPVQSSRWLNTVMVLADSATTLRLRSLPFIIVTEVVRSRDGRDIPGLVKRWDLERIAGTELSPCPSPEACITDEYGFADFQNRFMGIDEAHRIGIAGEGVLIGVLDAGFDWRSHRAFDNTRVLGEYDFVYGNINTADELEDTAAVNGSPEEHGTMVLSLIGANWRDTLVGGAPNAEFMLAKTEDLRFERNVEEDNLVAGLEWLEANGVDITNTSLGYTGFDAPERSHTYEDLTGHTAHASRGVNHAVGLGVVCLVSAGNDGAPGRFIYVGVPADADSAITVAAVDSNGRVAGFSSRGFGDRTPAKPDVAGFGVGNWAAHPAGNGSRVVKSQGTSFSSPMTAAVAALVLSAAPELRPWELRDILVSSASQFDERDTALGAGIVHAGRALRELAKRRIVVGVPVTSTDNSCGVRTLSAAAYTIDRRVTSQSRLDSHVVASVIFHDGSSAVQRSLQPVDGIARWDFGFVDSFTSTPAFLVISDANSGEILRRDTIIMSGRERARSTLCAAPKLITDALGGGVDVYPNPFDRHARLTFTLAEAAVVSLAIHNALGEEVARVYDERWLPAGIQMPMFDGAGLPSGSYYARLRVGATVRTGAMIYIP